MAVNAGSVLNAKTLFAFVKSVKAPKTGDLRDPVTFYHSHRLPVKDPATGLYTDDMENDVTPYHNAWSQVWQAQAAMLDGQNTQNQISHVFLIRRPPGIVFETKDAVLYAQAIHMIRGTRNLENDPEERWLLILAEQEGMFREEPRKVIGPDGSDPLSEYERDDGNPLWL